MRPVAVITPLHAQGTPFVSAAYESLTAQSEDAWTWTILENAGGLVPERIRSDARVRVLTLAESPRGIGALKLALSRATDPVPYVLELDADDLLSDHAVSRVLGAFEAGQADFVFSDWAEFRDVGSGAPWEAAFDGYPYDARMGWERYPVTFHGRPLWAMRAPEATEHNVRRVEWSPNHVRAWRRDAYEKAGGHDPSMAVGDDHDLIVRMLLTGAKFVHVPACLYFYRVHGHNTVRTRGPEIEAATSGVYDRRFAELGDHFARVRGLSRVDLGGGMGTLEGYLALDRAIAHGVMGLSCELDEEWPLESDSVGVLRAFDVLHRIRNPVHVMNEAFRVLAPGGFLLVRVPSTDGPGAFCDPRTVSFWNALSFRYFAIARYAARVPQFKGRFQIARGGQRAEVRDYADAQGVPYVEAHLFALKDSGSALIMGERRW